MSDDELELIYSGLLALHEAASLVDGWPKDDIATFIYVGEYTLALDSIAYAYLDSGKPMTNDQFRLFERLADLMAMDKDPEYQGVARLRAQGAPS